MSSVQTTFNPSIHGWPFSNWAPGVCAGMVLGALDYFHFNIPIPTTSNAPPPQGSALHQYVTRHHASGRSLGGMSMAWQIFGTDSHFKRWAWGALDGCYFNTLRRFVDGNRPIPVLLMDRYVGIGIHHMALGIGYDVRGRGRSDVRIHIYDPNHPGQRVYLVPIEGRGPPLDRYNRSDYDRYVPTQNGNLSTMYADRFFWGTYFVHDGYAPQRP